MTSHVRSVVDSWEQRRKWSLSQLQQYCFVTVEEEGQFSFTEWFVSLSSGKAGGAALGPLPAGMCGLYVLAALPVQRD